MSNFNYMEGVPVKIAEKYKPPPRIYQLPQTVVNKLQLPVGYYHESSQFSYDFQLERKVAAKIPEYRRMRQLEREARQCRREKREIEQQRLVEEKNKQMLGAVNYPNAEDIGCSSDNENEESNVQTEEKVNLARVNLNKDTNWQHHNFNNILQPTVLTMAGSGVGSGFEFLESNKITNFEKNTENQNTNLIKHTHNMTTATGNVNSGSIIANSFNYKDFEEDTSSPFDNIELKTINDLDILAQVLHDTQFKAKKEEVEDTNGVLENKNDVDVDEGEQQQEKTKDLTPIEALHTTIEHTKAALEKVNFSDINLDLTQQQQQGVDNIPQQQQHYANNVYLSYPNNFATQQQSHYQVYNNQNVLYTPNCNGLVSDTNAMMQHFIGNNANNYVLSLANEQLKQTASYHNAPKSTPILQIQQEEKQASKSKSVPDILRELRDEVRNSEMRRSRLRNNSCNQSGEQREESTAESPTKIAPNDDDFLKTLEVPVQILARNISSMGFPLGRVVNVAKIYGDDDKKIVEHLIPLTELLDLGFEEKRISEALLKFDNNKEKALEHLIS